MYSLKYNKETGANGDIFKFNWTIDDFLNKIKDIREYRTKKSSEICPQLRLQIVGHHSTTSIVEVSCMLPISVIMSVSLTVLRGNISANFALEFVEANKWIHLTSIYRSDIEKFCCSNNLSNNGYYTNCTQNSINLKLKLKFTFTVQKYFHEKTHGDNIKNSMYSDFKDIFKSGNFSDVVIKSKEGKQYRVHKLILMTRSPVLKAHFDHGTKESQTNIIEAPFESDVIEEVLSYMYCDEAPRIEKLRKEILVAADYYEINGLKALCVDELGKKLPEEIAKQMLELADSCQATKLKEAATKFLKQMQFFAGHMDDNDWQVVTCTPDSTD